MKTILILATILGFSGPVWSSPQEKELYSCSGFSREDRETEDLIAKVFEVNQQTFVSLELGTKKGRFQVERKALKEGEISFFETFLNKSKNFELMVFLDDMGSTSSMTINGVKFTLTCSSWD